MGISFSIYPRKDHVKKDGTAALYLWVTIDRKLRKYKLLYYVDPQKWDWKNKRMKSFGPLSVELNKYISDELAKVNTIAVNISNRGKSLSFDEFESVYLSNKFVDFYGFIDNYIEINKGKLSPGYLTQIKAEKTKLQQYKQSLSFQDITFDFICEYEHYMRNVLHNKTNTVHKTLKKIKSLVNTAMIQNESLYSRSPFTGYKMTTEPTHREYLTKEELDKLYSMRNEFSGKLANVVQYFLFSCYTGLRFEDIGNLKFRHIQPDRINSKILKTGEQITIPLTNRAQELLPGVGKPDDPVFRILSNQKTNDYLKLAIEKVGIDKNISFHCARHTFATVALNSDIPLEVVQKLLGHSMIRTTQIYAKIVNKTIFEQMKKFS
ncbi:Tyrosine recombinase XerC [bioreactor metagenome]|uniref:Tyrosine recombinase XerC n=1 Tax=bioreactor metagenome TaxID=1076179 RepID=A0A644XGH9_9ZZZZ